VRPFRPSRADLVAAVAAALLAGVAAGVLAYMSFGSLPQAVLTGGSAAGGAAGLVRQFTGGGTRRRTADGTDHGQQRSEN
jgi:flavin-dependent dehydrogenase